ncbi:MAG: AAA family ATPase [Ruminococcus sp.]
MQFTPDVLPSDLTGFPSMRKARKNLCFNRAHCSATSYWRTRSTGLPARRRAALLEAMEEGNVTVEGKTYALPQPHLVIATQNPLGCVGTQSLPESQLDRF